MNCCAVPCAVLCLLLGLPRGMNPAAWAEERPGSQPGDAVSLSVRPNGGLNELVIDSGAVLRSTPADVGDARVIRVPGSTVVLALWNESAPAAQPVPFYAISFDGRSFSRARETSYEVRLVYDAFDPVRRLPGVVPDLGADPTMNLYIVQFVTQPLEVFRERIRAAGGEVYSFIAHHAHVVRMTPDVRAQVEAMPFVRWVGPMHPAYRLEPYLHDNLAQADALFPKQRYHIRVAERGARLKHVVAERIEALGGQINANFPEGFLLQATLTPAQLMQVVRWDEVLFVDRWGPPEEDMDIARELSGANFLEAVAGFTGQGVRAEVMDGNVNEEHAELTGKLILHGNKSGSESHGTSTSGINFSTGTVNAGARGMVPGARGIFASYTFLTNRHTHTAQLLQSPYFAVYQSNSWGDPLTTQYTNTSSDFDDVLFENDILICQSQSNSGNQQSRPQAWAKNVVSVGGIYHRNNLDPSDDFWDDASIGPAADGRVKPDLVHFYDQIFTITASGYTNFCCTSGATPIVAGHFGLFYQMWHEGVFGNSRAGSVFHSRPHMSTAKAMMINAAHHYPFTGLNANLTRTHQGWGMPRVGDMYENRDRLFIVNETDVLTNLQSTSYTLTVPADANELRATLVYTDPAGAPFASVHRVNDLSLRVSAPGGTVYYGNNGLLEGNWSAPGGSPNTIDTVENVFVDDPTPGQWTFEVLADEINQDSHVETPGLDADYALVVSGVVPVHTLHSYFDTDLDGDVDLGDFEQFDLCGTGPVGSEDFSPIVEGCEAADCDGDGDVDFVDYGCFVRSFSGDCGLRIVNPPVNQAACVGGPAQFSVDVEGENVSFQWFHGVDAVPGGNGPTLTIPSVSNASAGSYFVLASNACAIKESAPATLAVSQPPQIVSQPMDVAACFGGPASFSIDAAGVGVLSFQWYHDNVPVAGATEATYTIPSVAPEHLGDYWCTVEDDCGFPVASDVVQLTTTSTAFTVHPAGGEVCLGNAIFLFSSATGTPAYQWFKDDEPIPGATSPFLSIPVAVTGDSGTYHAVATGQCNVAVSNDAVITVVSCGGTP